MFGKRSPYEGRSAREVYGKPSKPKSVDQIVRDQCREANKKLKKK